MSVIRQPQFRTACAITFIFALFCAFQNCSNIKTGGELGFKPDQGSQNPYPVLFDGKLVFTKLGSGTCSPNNVSVDIQGFLKDQYGNIMPNQNLVVCARAPSEPAFQKGGCLILVTDANGKAVFPQPPQQEPIVSFCTTYSQLYIGFYSGNIADVISTTQPFEQIQVSTGYPF